MSQKPGIDRASRDDEYIVCDECKQELNVTRVWDSRLPDNTRITYTRIPHHVLPQTNAIDCDMVGLIATVQKRQHLLLF